MAKGRPKKEVTGRFPIQNSINEQKSIVPLMADQSFGTSQLNRIRQGDLSDSHLARFNNLKHGIMPFQTNGCYISVKDAVYLCQKAYFNVSVFRNAINTLAELCNTDIYLEGGNEQSTSFFEAWFKRINLWKLKDMFFRELFRSGNVFMFRLDGNISRGDALKLNQAYGERDLQLPLKYILLNVADIAAFNNITYETPAYYKILTPQQVKILKQSKNSDDKEIYKNLPAAIKNYFDGGTGNPIPIDLSKLHTIFYQKQDYEPFAIPIGFGLLDDLNLKMEFKKTDAILARTVEYATLLVTQGTELNADGTGGTSATALRALNELFSKEQIGRVLVGDFSTKLEWIIPDLTRVMGPEKYQVVNQDIASGLMDIFFGDQKFANVAAKLKVFIEKLNRVQEIFINDFLQAEIRRVSEMMNFKSYPTAKFVKVTLDDQTQMMRVYTQLMQLGILTPKDGIEAVETGELPDFDILLENQEEYKKLKDKGLFQPVMGGVQDQLKVLKETGKQELSMQEQTQDHTMKMADKQRKHDAANPAPTPPPAIHINAPGVKVKQPEGRPPGAKAPQTTKKVSPIGTSKASDEQKFSMAKLIDNIKLMDKIKAKMIINYKKENELKRLTESHKELVSQITKTLFENESVADWDSKVEEYIKEPVPPDIDKALEIEEISNEYDISNESAVLLYHSKL